jgi:hypothetical protein
MSPHCRQISLRSLLPRIRAGFQHPAIIPAASSLRKRVPTLTFSAPPPEFLLLALASAMWQGVRLF